MNNCWAILAASSFSLKKKHKTDFVVFVKINLSRKALLLKTEGVCSFVTHTKAMFFIILIIEFINLYLYYS